MSQETPDETTPWPHSREDAEVEDIVTVLRRYGVLTLSRLVEVCGAAHWSDHGFGQALDEGVAAGRIKRLGDERYEAAEPPSPAATS